MKKIFFPIVAIFLLSLFACNKPMEDLIQQVQQASYKPYSENIEYTLTDDDYNTIASVSLVAAQNAQDSAACSAIKTYHSFAETRPAAQFIPPFLAYKFPALDSGSIAKVTYNFDNSYIFSSNEQLTVPQEVYDELGISEFDADNPPADLIPTWLDTAAAANGLEYVVVKYNYDDGNDVQTLMMYFKYDNGWTVPDQYYITDADYESIAPGTSVATYHNFSSSYPPDHYIPIFLKLKFPYAYAGDAKEVIYKYYSGGVQVHKNKYIFDGNEWQAIEVKTDQFIHNGTAWVFDPTVKFEMSCSDYQLIVDWVKENKPEYMHPVYNNTEYYFGASAYYCNFDMRLTTRRQYDADNLLPADDAEAMAILWQRLDEGIMVMLQAKYPDAQPYVNGVPVYYEVTFSTYEPERHKYMIKFLCTGVGQFEPVEQDGAIADNPHIVLVQ